MEIPSSKHMVDLAYRWPMEKAIETSIEATKFAHKNGLEVVFFPIDFSRAELKWAIDLIDKVGTEGHMDALALVDTFGVLSPHAMKYFVTQVQSRIKKRLEAHFHQDFGMGVANTIIGSGLYQIESGIIASWFKNCGEKNATELFPIRWSAVGQPPAEVVMGKGSGIDSVNMWLKDVGMQVSEEDAMKILTAVKASSLKSKKMLSHAEFRDVARATLGRTQQAAE